MTHTLHLDHTSALCVTISGGGHENLVAQLKGEVWRLHVTSQRITP